MTRIRTWALLSALVLGLGANGAPAQCPKEGCGKASICPNQTGSVIIGTGVNSDAGLTGSIILNERTFNCTKFPYPLSGLTGSMILNGREFNCTECPTAASNFAAGEKCPDCETCPGCYQKCPECEGCCTKSQACSGCSAETCAPKKGTFTVGIGFTLLPGPLPLPVPILRASVGGGAGASCCPPVKAPPAAVGVYEPEEKEFCVETRLMEKRAGRQEQILLMPRLTVLEGQQASMTVCGGVPQAGQRGEATPEGMDSMLQVQVEELDSGNLLLDLTVQRNMVEKSNKSGTVIQCRRLAAIQEVKPGKATKLVLEKDDKGGARTWLEVMVKAAKPDACIPPAVEYYGKTPVPQPQPVAAPPEMAPPPVPMTVFVPQLMPPQTAPMMVPVEAAVPCPRPVAELIPCNGPAVVAMPAVNLSSVFRAIKEDGHARLEVLHGPFGRMTCPSMTWGAPGCQPLKFTVAGERVHVAGDALKGDALKAYASRVIADADDHLVLEGQVRLTYAPVYENGATGQVRHIKADKVTIHLRDGHLDVEVKTKSKD